MNGLHDMGGFQSFGPVRPETDEPVFHALWERRLFALSEAAPGTGNIDTFRHAVESLPPVQYLSLSYYEKWLAVLERALIKSGLVTRDELEAGRQLHPPAQVAAAVRAQDVPGLLAKGSPAERRPTAPASFGAGDPVRSRNLNPQGHTRLPRYARGRLGTVERVHGCHVFPDSNARGDGEQPQWLYSVRFSARELWGTEAAAGDSVNVDMWEPYLEPA